MLLAEAGVPYDIVEEMEEPFRSGQQSLGVHATYAVPVLVEGVVWGIVAMDYCHEPKRLKPAELAVFQTATTCVGSAIYQEQVRRDRAAQERAAELTKVNLDLAALCERFSQVMA